MENTDEIFRNRIITVKENLDRIFKALENGEMTIGSEEYAREYGAACQQLKELLEDPKRGIVRKLKNK